jgi:Fe-S cluster assembly iron-binding protein IscA
MLTVTAEAQAQLTDIIDSTSLSDPRVRVSVVRGPHGCVHGWILGLEQEEQPDDLVLTFGALRLLVEHDLEEALEDATIDYRMDASAIGFTIDAPGSQAHGGQGGCGNH